MATSFRMSGYENVVRTARIYHHNSNSNYCFTDKVTSYTFSSEINKKVTNMLLHTNVNHHKVITFVLRNKEITTKLHLCNMKSNRFSSDLFNNQTKNKQQF